MMQTINKVSLIGEEIGLELGQKFIQDFQTANQVAYHFTVGRQIIEQILAQPGCEGIRMYQAYNEAGEETLVYMGINAEGEEIIEYSCVNPSGVLESYKGIVADRLGRGRKGDGTDGGDTGDTGGGDTGGGNSLPADGLPDPDGWGWTID
jgi:hypothetical protein